MPFTVIYLSAAIVISLVIGGIVYRRAGMRRACVSVACTCALCLVLYAGFVVLRAGN